jgi:transcriptional regulator with XRE-family HTH domain
MKDFERHLKKMKIRVSVLARITGYSRDYLYKIIRGDRFPSKKAAEKIAYHSGYSAIKLIFRRVKK